MFECEKQKVTRSLLISSRDSLFQEIKSVNADENVSISVDLQEIAKVRIKPKAANWESWIVIEERNFWGMEIK